MRRLFAPWQRDDELRKSEARYRTVLDAAFDAIVTITPDGIVRWFNRGAERIFGHRAEEVIGQPVTLLMPERYRDLCVAGLHRYLRTGEARVVGVTTELVGLRKDGSEFPIEMSLGETHENGERLFTGVIRDITERKRTEDALREARDRFRSLFDHAPIGVAMVTLEGRYVQVNRSLCEILGYCEEALQSLTWQEITHPDDLAASSAYARRIVEGEFPRYHLEKRFLHADGHTVWASLSVSLVRDSEGEPLYFVSQIQDVTERKKAEKVIIESEERFRSLVQYSSDIITILDAEGTVQYVSPAVERITGYKPEERIGTNAFDTVHPDDGDRALDTFAEVLKRPGLHPPLEFRVPHKDGSWRYLEHVVNNLLDDPAVRGVVINSRDVTERNAMEEQLQHQAFHDPLTGLPFPGNQIPQNRISPAAARLFELMPLPNITGTRARQNNFVASPSQIQPRVGHLGHLVGRQPAAQPGGRAGCHGGGGAAAEPGGDGAAVQHQAGDRGDADDADKHQRPHIAWQVVHGSFLSDRSSGGPCRVGELRRAGAGRRGCAGRPGSPAGGRAAA